MQITLDIKDVLIGLLIIAAVVLLIFLTVLVANAIKSVKKLNGILDDASVVTGIVQEKAQETKPVVDDLSSALVSFSRAAKGEESNIASLSSVAKSISSLIAIIKKNK